MTQNSSSAQETLWLKGVPLWWRSLSMRIGAVAQSVVMVAGLAAPSVASAADSGALGILDLRLPREAEERVTDTACFVRRRCINPDSYRPPRAASLTEAPRMSLPLGTYGAASFNFTGSRVRMNVSF